MTAAAFFDAELRAYRNAAYTASTFERIQRRVAGLGQAVEVAALGMDVSHWQASIDFQSANVELDFAFIRALYGLEHDTKFAVHWPNSRGVVPRHAYLYYREAASPVEQAQALFDRCQAAGDFGDILPVIDVESYANPTLTADRIRRCVEKIEDLFDVPCTIYTGFYVWRDSVTGDKAWAITRPLWIASYPLAGWQDDYPTRVLNYPPRIPAPWTAFSVWQWTSSAPASRFGVSGTYLDLNYCTQQYFDDYIMDTPEPPPSPDEIIILANPNMEATHRLNKNVLLWHGPKSQDWTEGLNAGDYVQVLPYPTEPQDGRVRARILHPAFWSNARWIPVNALDALPQPIPVRFVWPGASGITQEQFQFLSDRVMVLENEIAALENVLIVRGRVQVPTHTIIESGVRFEATSDGGLITKVSPTNRVAEARPALNIHNRINVWVQIEDRDGVPHKILGWIAGNKLREL